MDVNQEVNQAKDAVTKTATDASNASNAFVQDKGPEAVSFIHKYWYVWVGLIAVCVAGWVLFH